MVGGEKGEKGKVKRGKREVFPKKMQKTYTLLVNVCFFLYLCRLNTTFLKKTENI